MTAPTPRRRQPKGISTGGEFAHNEHDEASPFDPLLERFHDKVADYPDIDDGYVETPSSARDIGTGMHAAVESAYAQPDPAPVPDAITRGAEIVGQPFRDDHTPVGFNGVAAKVLGLTSVYYYDDEGRIVGRVEIHNGRTNYYAGDRLKGGEYVSDDAAIFRSATIGAIQRNPGGDKRPGFVGADRPMLNEQERLRAGLFSDRISDSALIIGVMEGQLSRGVCGKDAYAEVRAWSYASHDVNPEFHEGIEDTIGELYGDTPMTDIPKKRPKIVSIVRWEDSVSSTGTISASRRRGRMVAAAVLSGQSKWWGLRDNAQEIIEA